MRMSSLNSLLILGILLTSVGDSSEVLNLSLVNNITRILNTILDNYDRKFRPGNMGE